MSLMDSILARALNKQGGSTGGSAPAYIDAAEFGIAMNTSSSIELTAEQIETFKSAVASKNSGIWFATGEGYMVFSAVNYVDAFGMYFLGGIDATTGSPWSLTLTESTLAVTFGATAASVSETE